MKFFGINFHKGEFVERFQDAIVRWSVEKIKDGWIVRGSAKGRLEGIEVARFKAPEVTLSGGWQSWSVVDAKPPKKKSLKSQWHAKDSPVFFDDPVGDYYIAGEGFIAGFLSSRIGHPYFKLEDDEIVAYIHYFGAEFDDYIPIEPFVYLEGKDISHLLEFYSSLVAQENEAAVRKRLIKGWSSWYQYFLDLSWEDVLKNLKAAKEWDFDVFQIDDGYESDIGDWLKVKEGFPSIDVIATTIEDAGFTPGIWVAPFIASESSKVFNEHPNWFVKENGKPMVIFKNWGENIYAFDLTKEGALIHIENIFSSLKKMGFKFFKIDFVYAGGVPGEREKNVTPIQAYRRGLEVIRNAVKDATILGCGAPILPSVGFVDAMRIGPDTAPNWEGHMDLCARCAIKNAVTRYYFNEKLWLNDPDCLLLRKKKSNLKEGQIKLYGYTSALLSNVLLVSDDLELLNEEDREFFKFLQKLKPFKTSVENILSTDDNYTILASGTDYGNVKLNIDLNTGRYQIEMEGENMLKKRQVRREDGRIFNFYEEG